MKVSVRVAHQAHCPSAGKSALASVNATCRKAKCRPTYYTFHRQPVGADAYKPIKGKFEDGRRGYDRQVIERARDELQRDLERGSAGFVDSKRITFPAWVDKFAEILDASVRKGDLKPRTEREYLTSLRTSQDAIGYADLRRLGASELQRVDDANAKLAPASRARHLKQLSVCLSRAVDHGYLDVNPVPKFMRTLKLNRRIPKRGKAPFEDGELVRLWSALDDEDTPVYRYASEFAAETGIRIGELAALDWPAVSVQDKTVKVLWTWNDTDALVLPKDRDQRTIFLTPHALGVLERWIEVTGAQDSGPVFPSPDTGGRLSIRAMQRRFEKAMTDAGVPKVHPALGLKRSFHSLRYTTSVLMQRRGLHPRLIEATLGHSNLELTYGVYGGWTPDQLAAEAGRVM